jgi:hypothetical protein
MIEKGLGINNAKKRFRERKSLGIGDLSMMAYELYSIDVKNRIELIGILPERRKDPRRINDDSILNWGRMILGNRENDKKIFYKCIIIEDNLDGVLGI